MALPASIALPPPKPMTTSQCSALASCAPRTTASMVGSPETAKVTEDTPLAFNKESKGWARSTLLPVTISARSPNPFARLPTSRAAPAPKMIRLTVTNSKRIYEFNLTTDEPGWLRISAAGRGGQQSVGRARLSYVFSVLAAPVAQTWSLSVSLEIVAGRDDSLPRRFFFLAPRRRSGEKTEERGGRRLSPARSPIRGTSGIV